MNKNTKYLQIIQKEIILIFTVQYKKKLLWNRQNKCSKQNKNTQPIDIILNTKKKNNTTT